MLKAPYIKPTELPTSIKKDCIQLLQIHVTDTDQ